MTEPTRPLSVTRAALIGSLIVLVVAGLCLRLGFWQLSRLAQRDARNELLSRRMALPPLELQFAAQDTTGLLYRRVLVNGRYDQDRTIVLPGRALRGVPGVHVLTPVLLEGSPRAVLVNRGWVGSADGATVDFDSLRVTPDVKLVGLVLPFPARGRRKPSGTSDTVFRRQWFFPDLAEMRGQFPYPLLEFEVQALPDKLAPRFPIRLQPPALDRGPHLGYAIQWFSFATIAVVGWVVLMIRKGEVRR